MDVGAVLGRSWELYTRFFGRFALTAGAVFLALNLAAALLEETASDGDLGRALASLAALAVTLVGYFWIQGVLVLMTDDVRDGRADVGIGELFARVRPVLGALVVAGVLATLGVIVGLVLLIVPGLYLLTRWAVIIPVIVLERVGAGASFTRSHELVRGRGWPVFGLLVLLLVIGIVASAVISLVIAAALDDFVGNWLGGAVVDMLFTPFLAIATTLVYFELGGRGGGDGGGDVPEAATF